MQTLHDHTNITLKKYYSEPQFIDYTTQPQNHKRYPHFYRRFDLGEYEELQFIQNFGKPTFTKEYGNDKVVLRSIPSAGGLYPCEIYIQIRKVKGLLSGIYHYEPLSNVLTLIHELSNDGLEVYFEEINTAQQFIIFISCVPFRTSWKYEDRSIRYLLLDCGHQIAAVDVAAKMHGIDLDLTNQFDHEQINALFGFDNKEYMMCALTCSLETQPTIKPLRSALPFVPACDYYIANRFIEDFFKLYTKQEKFSFQLPALHHNLLQEDIEHRRSCRAFKKEPMQKEQFDAITNTIFELAQSVGVEIFYINNNIEGLEQGLYKNVEALKIGDFRQKGQELALNQALGGNSGATLFFSASQSSNYVLSTLYSAYLAHIIYLRCAHEEIECSAVGAYFDEECQRFLESSNNILYLVCIGK